ncbi:beta-ketoacyl synthase N-terminal-like domain-containing protein [Streptomyces sp. NRRL S-87]|uniref:beta-ketoacyl synthase N-terminal-like domain-containing protein n=1 Tax=Streptomyces sp. NRRL S-87 TaxID=1463920 RepID=UPI001F3D4A30|nr:beta-ketoacyl synthase N-terminal-like domain-containing protein [Streptomyces sp. NRRL S-87]
MTQHTSGDGAMTPVAVIGMSCRFPGAAGPARFWHNLAAGTDSVGPVPADRRPATAPPGADAARGGFVEGADAFDAAFFGVSQREARYTDPQQRLLLELAWECFEDAARPAADLRDSGWGVFVGAAADDFRARYLTGGGLDRFGHAGTARCMLANRVSHHFGLRGPSEVVDTGQSSSLAAVHRAVSSLRLGECEAALVGGVQLNLLQEVTDQIGLWGGLSPDGRCHTFDARANGYVRGEGGGCVLLKPLPAALRDGDHVYAVVRGSAVGNDGGRGGLAVPSEDAQYEAVTRALRVAGARPEDLAYVELHGSGTQVGDPVEARALGAAVGRARPAGNPLPVGSVKTNIGHLESAAGIAGFIKACLVLTHGALPPSLNFETPHPAVDPAGQGLRVVDAYEDRPFGAGELVGVTSVGMGGTNVHVVLGPAPATAEDPVPDPDQDEDTGTVWCLSGRSKEAVRDLADALLRELDRHPAGGPAAGVRAVGATLARRTHWEHRAAVVGADWAHFRDGLAKVAAGHGFAVPADWATAAGPAGAGCVRAAGDYVHAGRIPEVPSPSGGRGRHRPVPGLPTYPFQRERFPLPGPAPATAAAGSAPAAPAPVATPAPGPAPAAGPAPGSAAPAYPRSWAAAGDEGERLWATQVLLERELAAVLGGSVPDLDPEVPLTDLGVDSMTLLEFLDRLIEATGLELSETVVFDHPTISEMAACVNKEMESRHG